MISFNNASALGNVTASSLTASYTVGGNALFVGVSSDNAVTATYAGLPMSIFKTGNVPAGRNVTFFILANPPSGANNVVINGGSSGYIEAVAGDYVSQGSIIDTVDVATVTSATSISDTLSSILDNDWAICIVVGVNQALTAGTGTTRRVINGTNILALFDNNGAISPPGSVTLNVNAAGSQNMCMLIATFSTFIPPEAIKAHSQPYLSYANITYLNNVLPVPRLPTPPPNGVASWVKNSIYQPYFPAVDVNPFSVSTPNVETYAKPLGWYKIKKTSSTWTKIEKIHITSG